MDKLTAWLDPVKRKALYGLLLAAGTTLVVLGKAPQVAVENWVEVAVQVLGIVGLLLAGFKTKRIDYRGIYVAAAALVAGLTAAGVWNDDQASQIYDLMAQGGVVLMMYQAFVRTNTTVVTGQPIEEAEYDARHAEPAGFTPPA